MCFRDQLLRAAGTDINVHWGGTLGTLQPPLALWNPVFSSLAAFGLDESCTRGSTQTQTKRRPGLVYVFGMQLAIGDGRLGGRLGGKKTSVITRTLWDTITNCAHRRGEM